MPNRALLVLLFSLAIVCMALAYRAPAFADEELALEEAQTHERASSASSNAPLIRNKFSPLIECC